LLVATEVALAANGHRDVTAIEPHVCDRSAALQVQPRRRRERQTDACNGRVFDSKP
jgi:hypothetical protein